MVPRAAMDAAHAAAVMVRAHGPDPKGRKMRRHAFFHTESGDTTLSASGFLSIKNPDVEKGEVFTVRESGSATVSGSSIVVVTCASIIEPFLYQQPYGTSSGESQAHPKLIPGAEVDVLVEVPGKPADGDNSRCWLPAQLHQVVDIPAAGAALQALLDVHGGSVDGAWEIGWALAPVEGSSQIQGLNAGSYTCAQSVVGDEPARRWASSDKEPVFSSSSLGGIQVGSLATNATRIAVLTLCGGNRTALLLEQKDHQHACELHKLSQIYFDLALAESRKRGDFLLAVGSPFGALSPLHFHNSLSAGVVANCWPPTSRPAALLMADLRCLPGMEGGPVFDEHGALIGMLTRPLRQRGGGAEVQLVMTSEVLAPALQQAGVTLGVPFREQPHLSLDVLGGLASEKGAITTVAARSCRGMVVAPATSQARSTDCVPSAIEQAVESVVLVTIGDGAWASGVILNTSGLILTNAHLLEPWRFGRMRSSQTDMSKCNAGNLADDQSSVEVQSYRSNEPYCAKCLFGAQTTPMQLDDQSWKVNEQDEKSSCSQNHCRNNSAVGMARTDTTKKVFDPSTRSYQRIRVRLDHVKPRCWRDATAVFVSQGPLDIALLQLVSPPPGLRPVIPEESCPVPGSTAVVIGHGLFGPRAELCPSVSAGVVARVVKAGKCPLSKGLGEKYMGTQAQSPAMLQTTAAVHPGGSGGAVVNDNGRMIGLVTSNARHSGGSVIPFLNFSVPVAALAPTFDFAARGGLEFSVLVELDKPDKPLSAVWALVPSTPPRPPSLPSAPKMILPPFTSRPPHLNSDKDGKPLPPKGIRFAEFMAEKGSELSFPAPVGSVQQQSIIRQGTMVDSLSGHQFCSRL